MKWRVIESRKEISKKIREQKINWKNTRDENRPTICHYWRVG